MDTNVYQYNLNEKERVALAKLHTDHADELQAEISEKTAEMIEARRRAAELLSPKLPLMVEAIDFNSYASTWVLHRKAEYVLREYGAMATTRTIANLINKQEGGKLNEDEIKDFVSSIGATLKPKVDRKIAFGRAERNGEIYYGLLEWFKEDGSVVDTIRWYPASHHSSYIGLTWWTDIDRATQEENKNRLL
jgi:hypothetical protein